MFEGLHKRASTHTLRPDEAGGFYEIKSRLHGLREFFKYTTGLTANQDPTFGLADTNSVLGNADEYTLAGSVYFDNLIYRLKLFNQTKTLPPIKYDGMKVVINDADFQNFKSFFDRLSTETSEVKLKNMLTSKPKKYSETNSQLSAMEFVSKITDKDLEALFKQLRSVQHACAVENADSESAIAIMRGVLLEAIKEMKLKSPQCYHQTKEFARIKNIYTQIQKHDNKMRSRKTTIACFQNWLLLR